MLSLTGLFSIVLNWSYPSLVEGYCIAYMRTVHSTWIQYRYQDRNELFHYGKARDLLSPRVARAGGDNDLSCHQDVMDVDDTLEQPKPSSNLNALDARDEDREQDSSGDEDGGLDWTKLPYVHLPLD